MRSPPPEIERLSDADYRESGSAACESMHMTRMRAHLACCATLSLSMASWPCAGQTTQTATVSRNTNLRRDPSTAQAPIRVLQLGQQLRLLSPNLVNRYYNVATSLNE